MTHDWTSFTLSISVKSTLKEMYDAWTTAANIERWFLETCTFIHKDSAIPTNHNVQSNTHYEWTWYLYDEMENGIVFEANNKDFLQFSFAGNCIVEVRLTEIDEHVKVTLTQNNIPTDEKSKFNIRIGCLEGWTFYFANLKSVYENGYDLRNKNPNLLGINN